MLARQEPEGREETASGRGAGTSTGRGCGSALPRPSSSSCVTGSPALLLEPLRGQIDDPLDRPRIVEAARRRRHRELARPLEVAARVDLEDIDVAGLGEPEIHPPVVLHPERPIRIDRYLL